MEMKLATSFPFEVSLSFSLSLSLSLLLYEIIHMVIVICTVNYTLFKINFIVAEKISESMNIVANEPSLAFFRIQEHVRKSLPQLVEQKVQLPDSE